MHQQSLPINLDILIALLSRTSATLRNVNFSIIFCPIRAEGTEESEEKCADDSKYIYSQRLFVDFYDEKDISSRDGEFKKSLSRF